MKYLSYTVCHEIATRLETTRALYAAKYDYDMYALRFGLRQVSCTAMLCIVVTFWLAGPDARDGSIHLQVLRHGVVLPKNQVQAGPAFVVVAMDVTDGWLLTVSGRLSANRCFSRRQTRVGRVLRVTNKIHANIRNSCRSTS